MQRTARTGGSRREGREGRHGAGRVVLCRVLGAGHLVDLNVAGREDPAAAGSRDPPLQPLVVHTAAYVDHLALRRRDGRSFELFIATDKLLSNVCEFLNGFKINESFRDIPPAIHLSSYTRCGQTVQLVCGFQNLIEGPEQEQMDGVLWGPTL